SLFCLRKTLYCATVPVLHPIHLGFVLCLYHFFLPPSHSQQASITHSSIILSFYSFFLVTTKISSIHPSHPNDDPTI
ncbi:hypothetical protein K443DRAFT_86533, partial [Laccaria amethystina LaAM-08-1]